MNESKPYFERIPVETVKKIAQQFPAKNELGDETPSIETPAGEGDRPQRASGFAFHNGILESGCFKRNRYRNAASQTAEYLYPKIRKP